MSDALVHALVRSRIAEIAADVASCRAVPRHSKPVVDIAQILEKRFTRGRTAGLTTHLALRDYLTAL